MHSSDTNDPVDRFTLELLRSGVALTDLTGDLIDAIPPDAHPGEDPAEVVLAMISGSISGFLSETDDAEVQRATKLISGALDRVLEHLQLALALRRRMEGEDGGRAGDQLVAADQPRSLDADADPWSWAGADPGLLEPVAPAVDSADAADPFDQLANELLDCGGVLSQVVAGMVEHQNAQDGSSEYVAIPDAVHALMREVLEDVGERHSEAEAAIAAQLVRDVTNAFTSDIFLDHPDWN